MVAQDVVQDVAPMTDGPSEHADLPPSRRTYTPPPPPTKEEDEELWQEAETAFKAWRASGQTYQSFLDKFDRQRAEDQYRQHFLLPGGDVSEPCPPGWEGRAAELISYVTGTR